MASVTKSVDVNVPVRVVYDQWTQFEEFPRFMEAVEQVRQLDDKRLHWRAKIGGQQEEWDAEITEQLPDQRIAWTAIGGAKNAGVVTFHRLDDQTTRVTLQMDYEPEGMTEKLGDMVGVMDRQVKTDLEKFKSFIESRGGPTGSWRGTIEEHPTTEPS